MTSEEIESDLRSQFQAELPSRVERYGKSRVHGIIPNGYFAAASSECRDLYVGGQFYGCITLAQSVAEGLAKFIAEKNGMPQVEEHAAQVNIIRKRGNPPPISELTSRAFKAIRGEDRNDFHHLDSDIEQDYIKLDARALACLEGLYRIESEVFAFQVIDGRIDPIHHRYWPQDGEALQVFLRLG